MSLYSSSLRSYFQFYVNKVYMCKTLARLLVSVLISDVFQHTRSFLVFKILTNWSVLVMQSSRRVITVEPKEAAGITTSTAPPFVGRVLPGTKLWRLLFPFPFSSGFVSFPYPSSYSRSRIFRGLCPFGLLLLFDIFVSGDDERAYLTRR